MTAFEESARKHWEYVREVVRDGRDEDAYIHLSIQDYLLVSVVAYQLKQVDFLPFLLYSCWLYHPYVLLVKAARCSVVLLRTGFVFYH